MGNKLREVMNEADIRDPRAVGSLISATGDELLFMAYHMIDRWSQRMRSSVKAITGIRSPLEAVGKTRNIMRSRKQQLSKGLSLSMEQNLAVSLVWELTPPEGPMVRLEVAVVYRASLLQLGGKRIKDMKYRWGDANDPVYSTIEDAIEASPGRKAIERLRAETGKDRDKFLHIPVYRALDVIVGLRDKDDRFTIIDSKVNNMRADIVVGRVRITDEQMCQLWKEIVDSKIDPFSRVPMPKGCR